jgi:predicted GH43/DUF377 family glycosyl hydrolase
MRGKQPSERAAGKGLLFLLLWSVVGISASVVPAFSQTDFERIFDDPVVPNGPAGSWDSTIVGYHFVLKVGDTFHMWYTGDAGGGIGHATSPDGVDWTKDQEANPVLVPGPPGSWDDTAVLSPYVIHDGDSFQMWYTGKSAWSGLGTEAVGYATSPDGIAWTKDDVHNPVLSPGSPGSWDEEWVNTPSVLKIDETYRMWFGAVGNGVGTIGYAESADGIDWTKNPDPVFEPSDPMNCFDRYHVHTADVHFNGDSFEMWYAGVNSVDRIGYATSSDGLSWERYSCDPIFDVGEPGVWDDEAVYVPRVLVLPSGYHLYYMGVSGGTRQIGYAFDDASYTAVDDPDGGQRGMTRPVTAGIERIFPNPFNPRTTIAFEVSHDGRVLLQVFDLRGRLVATLIDEIVAVGSHEVIWSGRGDGGREVPSGVYFSRLESNGQVAHGRMTLVR